MCSLDFIPGWFEVQEPGERGDNCIVVQAKDLRLATSMPDREAVTIKCIPRGPAVTGEVEQEVMMQWRLWHRHIIGFREVFLYRTHLCMVLDTAQGDSLADLVRMRGSFQEDLARWFFQQIVLAVDYCHRRNIAHRNIALDSAKIDETTNPPHVRLCSIRGSKDKAGQPGANLGSHLYVAPEMQFGIPLHAQSLKAGQAADIWSCGVALFHMLHASPFAMKHRCHSRSQGTTFQRSLDMEVVIPEVVRDSGEILSKQCQDFLRRILQVNPAERATMEEIWAHEWFQTNLPGGCKEYNIKLIGRGLLEEHYRDMQTKEEILSILGDATRPGLQMYS